MKSRSLAMVRRTFLVIVAAWLPSAALALSLEAHALASDPGSTELTEVLAKAVGLMEQGTEKLLAETRAREAQAEASGAAVADKASREATSNAMQQILKDFRSLHLIAGRLKGRVSSDIQGLQAQVAAQKQMLDTSTERLKNLQDANDILRASVKDEMSKTEECVVSLQEAQTKQIATSDKKAAAELEADKQKIGNLTNVVANLHQQLNNTNELCRVTTGDLQQEKDELQAELDKLNQEKAGIKADEVMMEDKVSDTKSEEKSMNKTMQEMKAEVAAAHEKEMDSQEEQAEDVSAIKDLKATNTKLYAEGEQRLKEVAKLQKDLDTSNGDRARLLDSVRMLVHENNAYQLKLSRAGTDMDMTISSGVDAPPGMKIQDVPMSNAAAVEAANTASQITMAAAATPAPEAAPEKKKFDAVAWMGKTADIDTYLSKLSTEQQQAADNVAAAKAAATSTPAPEVQTPLGAYVGVEPPQAAVVAKVRKAIEKHIAPPAPPAAVQADAAVMPDALEVETSPLTTAVTSNLRASQPAGSSKPALQSFLKSALAPPPEVKAETGSLEDIRDAENLYNEAEKLIDSAAAAL